MFQVTFPRLDEVVRIQVSDSCRIYDEESELLFEFGDGSTKTVNNTDHLATDDGSEGWSDKYTLSQAEKRSLARTHARTHTLTQDK